MKHISQIISCSLLCLSGCKLNYSTNGNYSDFKKGVKLVYEFETNSKLYDEDHIYRLKFENDSLKMMFKCGSIKNHATLEKINNDYYLIKNNIHKLFFSFPTKIDSVYFRLSNNWLYKGLKLKDYVIDTAGIITMRYLDSTNYGIYEVTEIWDRNYGLIEYKSISLSNDEFEGLYEKYILKKVSIIRKHAG